MLSTITAPAQRQAAEPPNRRRNILLAAEKLFAQRAYHAVSLRDIAAEAGVQVALVGYYFGGKQGLYHAIFESWLPSIQDRRARLADALASAGSEPPLRAMLEAFIAPVVQLHASVEGQFFAQMAARNLAAPTPEAEAVQREFFDPMALAYIDALQLLWPRKPRADIAWCYQFMLGAMLHFLSDRRVEHLSGGTAVAADPARAATLVNFVAAGFVGSLGAPSLPRKPATTKRIRT